VIYVQRSYRKPILRRIEPEFRVDRARRAASKALASEPGREARRLVALALALVGNGKQSTKLADQLESRVSYCNLFSVLRSTVDKSCESPSVRENLIEQFSSLNPQKLTNWVSDSRLLPM
jgi:hypothetical protein